MRYLLKNNMLSLIAVLAFAFSSCASLQNTEPGPQISSPYPVKVKVAKGLQSWVKVERVVVVPKRDKYIIQFTVKSNSDERLNFLYRVLVYDQDGLIPDYLTEKWTVASVDPNDEQNFEVIVPKNVVGNLSRVEVDLKTFVQ